MRCPYCHFDDVLFITVRPSDGRLNCHACGGWFWPGTKTRETPSRCQRYLAGLLSERERRERGLAGEAARRLRWIGE